MNKKEKYLIISIENNKYNECKKSSHRLRRIIDIHKIKSVLWVHNGYSHLIYFKLTSLKKDVLAKIMFLVGMYHEIAFHRIEE